MIAIFQALWQRKLARSAFLLLAGLYLLALFAPFLAPYTENLQNLESTYHPPSSWTLQDGQIGIWGTYKSDPEMNRYSPNEADFLSVEFFTQGQPYKLFGLLPMETHIFGLKTPTANQRVYLLGSDSTGRDLFSRLLYGAQISLSIGLIGISITMLVGFLVGALAGYFGGRIDFWAMRFVELLMAVPGLYLLLALRSALAPHFNSRQMFLVIIVILAAIGWASAARVIRGISLSLAKKEFVLAAESMGQSTLKIITKHIFPNLISYLLVAATLSIPGYILGEAALSFLGLGIQEPEASWGLMLRSAQDMKVFMLNFWWILSPGLAIFITVLAFNYLGDTLRDIVDPKALKSKRSA